MIVEKKGKGWVKVSEEFEDIEIFRIALVEPQVRLKRSKGREYVYYEATVPVPIKKYILVPLHTWAEIAERIVKCEYIAEKLKTMLLNELELKKLEYKLRIKEAIRDIDFCKEMLRKGYSEYENQLESHRFSLRVLKNEIEAIDEKINRVKKLTENV